MKCRNCNKPLIKKGKRRNKQRWMCPSCGLWESSPVHEEPRVLVIPDLHAPFMRDDAIDFLIDTYNKYECNQIVMIGDVMDNHYSSFHDSDPDGMGAGDELLLAIEQLSELARVFPDAKVCIGNHDAIPDRKAFNAGLSKCWIKSIKDVMIDHGIHAEGWVFSDSHVIDGVRYVHGIGRQAKQRMTQDGESIVQGHYHSRSSIEFLVNKHSKNFSMQVGALIDDDSYAMAYGKHFAKSHKNCGVVIGGTPILVYMDL